MFHNHSCLYDTINADKCSQQVAICRQVIGLKHIHMWPVFKDKNKELLQAAYIQDKRHDPLLKGTLLALKTDGKTKQTAKMRSTKYEKLSCFLLSGYAAVGCGACNSVS